MVEVQTRLAQGLRSAARELASDRVLFGIATKLVGAPLLLQAVTKLVVAEASPVGKIENRIAS